MDAAPSEPQPQPQPDAPADRVRPGAAARLAALIEVVLCSDYPTQLALGATFALFGFRPDTADGSLSIAYVVALSLLDTAILLALIVMFLRSHGESPRELFLGVRPVGPEIRRGIPLVFVALGIAVVVLLGVQQFAPWLHNVEHNPLQGLIRTRRDAAIFAVIVVVAGGVREEFQRAFVLRRFEQYLGGRTVGVVVGSIAFGAGHALQGRDAALATTLLGAFWAIVYLRRRSVVAPVVSHSGFNLLQLLQFFLVGPGGQGA